MNGAPSGRKEAVSYGPSMVTRWAMEAPPAHAAVPSRPGAGGRFVNRIKARVNW